MRNNVLHYTPRKNHIAKRLFRSITNNILAIEQNNSNLGYYLFNLEGTQRSLSMINHNKLLRLITILSVCVCVCVGGGGSYNEYRHSVQMINVVMVH